MPLAPSVIKVKQPHKIIMSIYRGANLSRFFYKIGFALGVVLLVINMIGVFTPLRHPDIYNEEKVGFVNDLTLEYSEAIRLLGSQNTLDREIYLRNTNEIFSQSIALYWEDESLNKYNITVSLYENYVLNMLQYIVPSIYKKYEFCGYKKALERGVGLCSQHAIAITDFLNQQGFEASIVGLNGHVVAQVKVNDIGTQWILDPDFNVVMPLSLSEIEMSPSIVKPYYEGKLGKNRNATVDFISSLYESAGNVIYPLGVSGYTDCSVKKILVERASYVLIWIIPFLLMLPFALSALNIGSPLILRKCDG